MTDTATMLSAVRAVGGDKLDMPFWEATRDGRFLVHRCEICARSYWPATRCVEHSDRAMAWVEATGKGTVATYTVLHHAYTPSMKDKVPYVVGVVQLDEGPFFHTNIIDCPIEEVTVGMAVECVMHADPSGLTLPMFRPAG